MKGDRRKGLILAKVAVAIILSLSYVECLQRISQAVSTRSMVSQKLNRAALNRASHSGLNGQRRMMTMSLESSKSITKEIPDVKKPNVFLDTAIVASFVLFEESAEPYGEST